MAGVLLGLSCTRNRQCLPTGRDHLSPNNGNAAPRPRNLLEVSEWVQAAKVANIMAYNRLGCMGHYYSGMLDIYSDLTQQYAHFGGHIELLEVEELAELRKEVSRAETAERLQLFHETFDIQSDCPPEELEKAAVTSVALERLVEKHKLGSMAYYYKGTGNPENEEAIASIILQFFIDCQRCARGG